MSSSPLVLCAAAIASFLKDPQTRASYPLLAAINIAAYGTEPGSQRPRLVLRILRQKTQPPQREAGNRQQAEARLLASLELVASNWAGAEKLAFDTADELRRALNSNRLAGFVGAPLAQCWLEELAQSLPEQSTGQWIVTVEAEIGLLYTIDQR